MEYTTIKLPEPLIQKIDAFIDHSDDAYTSRTDVVKSAVRDFFKKEEKGVRKKIVIDIGARGMKWKNKTYRDGIEDVLDLIKNAKEKESNDALGDLERDVIRLLKKYKS